MKNKKLIVWIILIIGILLLIGTFAWFTWKSSETTLVLKVGEIDDAEVILTPYKINKEIIPVLTYEGEEYTSVEAINRSTNAKRIILYYHINNIDSELINDNFKYTILRSTDNGNTYREYISGNFSNTSSDSEFYIMNERVETNTSYKYKVYLWLDGSSSGQGNIQGKKFDGELRAEILDGKIYANLGGTTDFYKADTYREKITKVEFVNNLDIPSGSITFDLGAYPSKTDEVKGWLISNGTDTYTLKIGANDKIYAKSLFAAFYNMTNLKEITFHNLDTSETTNMHAMFSNCFSLTSLDLINFDTSKVTNMIGMFNGCLKLTSLNLSNFDTSMVTNMEFMFQNCNILTSLYLGSFDTSNVTNMYAMFCGCFNLTVLNLSSFDTSKVTDMGYMFHSCSNLTNIHVSSLWNTSLVTESTNMFYNCFKLPNFNSSVIDKTNAHYNTGGYLNLVGGIAKSEYLNINYEISTYDIGKTYYYDWGNGFWYKDNVVASVLDKLAINFQLNVKNNENYKFCYIFSADACAAKEGDFVIYFTNLYFYKNGSIVHSVTTSENNATYKFECYDLKDISSTDTFKVDTSDWENRNLSVKWWISK